MKKVLIITYYWPPMGGGGVQRWLKFTKYLREYGWEPVIFTTEGGNISIRDESLYRDVPEDVEVIREPIREPYDWYHRLLGKKKGESFHAGFVEQEGEQGNSWIKRFALWVRGTLFIPDAKMLWIRPASRRILRYLKKSHIDAVVSTGPPHTTHLIAKKVRNKTGLPWLADFRDPWTNIDWYQHLDLGKWADQRHHRLEKEVLTQADKVVTVSWSWAEDFREIAGVPVEVVTNGYDEEDFKKCDDTPLTEAFTLTHAGSFNKDRNPHTLWKVLGELCQEDEGLKEDLRIRLIGPTDHTVRQGIEQNGMSDNLLMIDGLPHEEVIEHLCSSWVLLLPLNDTPNIGGVIPGKLYEYMGAHRPILCIGKPDADAGRIIQEARAGTITDFREEVALKKALRNMVKGYQAGKLEVSSEGVGRYSRRKLAGQVARELDAISG